MARPPKHNANRVSYSGKLAVKLSKSRYKFFNIINKELSKIKDYTHNAKNPIYNLRYHLKNQIDRENYTMPKLDFKLRDYEIQNGEKLLKSMFSQQKPIILTRYFSANVQLEKPKKNE